MSAVTPYEPPKQSSAGQLVDSVFILVLLMAVLFGVTYWVQSAASTESVKPKPIAELPITAAEKAQYQKLIDEGLVDLQVANDQVAASTAKPGSEQYPIKIGTLLLTFGVIGVYLFFVYSVSFKEYREVIRERFGPPGSSASSGEVGP
jgi:hypothetical protein